MGVKELQWPMYFRPFIGAIANFNIFEVIGRTKCPGPTWAVSFYTHPDHFDIFPHWLRVWLLMDMMDKLLHHQGWGLSHYLLGLSTSFDHPRWCSAGFLNHQQESKSKVPKFRELVVTVTCEDVLGFKNSTGPFSPPPSSTWGSQHHGVFFFSGVSLPGFWCFEWNFVAGPERDFYVQCLGHPK